MIDLNFIVKINQEDVAVCEQWQKTGDIPEAFCLERTKGSFSSAKPIEVIVKESITDYFDDISDVLEQHPIGMPGMRR